MSPAQTLYQLTGRGHAAASLGNASLLIIDAQEEYRSGVLRLPGLDAALAEIASLLAAARAAGSALVHIKHLGIPGGLLDPQGPRGQHLGRAALACRRLVAPLRFLFGLLEASCKNRTLGVDFVQFREYFLTRISETKNSRKQQLALRHLVNRLVPENARI